MKLPFRLRKPSRDAFTGLALAGEARKYEGIRGFRTKDGVVIIANTLWVLKKFNLVKEGKAVDEWGIPYRTLTLSDEGRSYALLLAEFRAYTRWDVKRLLTEDSILVKEHKHRRNRHDVYAYVCTEAKRIGLRVSIRQTSRGWRITRVGYCEPSQRRSRKRVAAPQGGVLGDQPRRDAA